MNNLDGHPPEGVPRKQLLGLGKYKMVYTINEMSEQNDQGTYVNVDVPKQQNIVTFRKQPKANGQIFKQEEETTSHTSSNGPVLRRKILLPTMESYTSTENLLDRNNPNIPNTQGVVNPAFVDNPDTVNLDTPPSWSDDTSSDNMKGDSRASTLTRTIPESQSATEAEPEEHYQKRYSVPLNDVKDDVKDSTMSSGVSEKKNNTFRQWDVFRIANRGTQSMFDDNFITLSKKIIKVIVSIIFTLFIIVFTMLSKSTLLLMTSNIYTNVTLECDTTFMPQEVTSCRRVAPDEAVKDTFQFSQMVEVRWVWALFIVICAPYFFTFCRCAWRVLFKKTRKPTFAILLAVIIIETINSFGVCLFGFYVLPSLDAIRGLVLTFGIAFIPSVLKIFDARSEKGRNIVVFILDVLCVAFQTSILVLWPVIDALNKEDITQAWAILVSLPLISLGWWENYVNKHTHLGIFGDKLRDLKRNIRRMRTKIYLLVSVWKILVTFAIMLGLMSEFKSECASAMLYRSDDKAKGCNHFVDPYKVANVEGETYLNDPFWIAIIQVFSSLFCYSIAKAACKILLQVVSFALPLMLVSPIMVGLFMGNCESWKMTESSGSLIPNYLYWTCDIHGITYDFLERLITQYYLPLAVGWWLSFMWATFHIWVPRVERLVQTERLFVQPLYNGIFLEQSLMLNRRRDDHDRDFRSSEKERRYQTDSIYTQKPDRMEILMPGSPGRRSIKSDVTPMIYVCATMWHETRKEMLQILTSLFRLDNDQCARKNAQKFFDVVDPDYYEFEVHIFFDDAFEPHVEDEYEYRSNTFVKQLVSVMEEAAVKVHRVHVKISPPTKYPTPYGGRLEWTLPGNNKLNVHLKDKSKIRIKKRWSQVMYMYFLLGYRLVASPLDARRKQMLADNTYILALDGDVDFKPSAVQLLVDRMKRDEKVGAACGRIHPIGTGPMIWYQKFEYAVSHWLQKATEHMIGCVLCSPGCFSLFRASSLMDDNVMRKYAMVSSAARHYVQFDQGEDRWLCTLLLQQGYRVEYSAAADALTYAPEGFNEFYNQRRRWSPSTMANIMDLLMDWRNVININENISGLYILYQLLLFVSSMITPGTIFLLIVGALNAAFKLDLITSLAVNLVPVILFLLSCYFIPAKWQVRFAGLLSLLYAMLMMVVVVGLGIEMKREGICSPTTSFLIFVVGTFVIAAILHPQEFYCLLHGAIYFLAIPSMSMLLMIYSICNLHVVSWGTRENAVAAPPTNTTNTNGQKKGEISKKIAGILNIFKSGNENETSDYECSFGNLFKCLCCPKPVPNNSESKFAVVLEKLELLEAAIHEKQNNQNNKISQSSGNIDDVSNASTGTRSDGDTATVENETKKSGKDEKTDNENKVKHNPLFQPKALPHEEDTPFWLHDPDLGHGKVRFLSKEEKGFWKELIAKYLYPLQQNKGHQQKMQHDLVQLRNKASLMFFMMNGLFIIIIFSLQYSNALSKIPVPGLDSFQGTGLAIPLPCYDTKTGEQLSLEPISLFFMAVFGIALIIQFFAMLFHRLSTFMHIMASTETNCMRPNQHELHAMDIASKVELVKEMQSFVEDDDARSISTQGSDLEEDSSYTQDDSPKIKRKKTVLRLTRRKRRQATQNGNLGGKFLTNFMEFAKDLEKRGSDKMDHVTKRKRGSEKKRSKRAMRALEALEQDKDNVIHKAEVIKGRWKRLAARAKNDPHGDKWNSLMRSVIGQSRTSLNTITEDDKRNSWVRGVMKMARSGSEYSVNTLPDLGSWSVRNSYAEPIMNLITEQLDAVKLPELSEDQSDISVKSMGVINNGKQEKNMDVILEQSNDQNEDEVDTFKHSFELKGDNSYEPIYDTADGGADVIQNSDSDTNSSAASTTQKTSDVAIEMTQVNRSVPPENRVTTGVDSEAINSHREVPRPPIKKTMSGESSGDTPL